MYLQQAIYTSANQRHMQGYQLVARSSGIDDQLSQELCRWSPSHGTLLESDDGAWSLNFFRPRSEWVAISRTFRGGPEYSDRGGAKIVTQILVCPIEQFAGYGNDPIRMSELAWALGYLRLQRQVANVLPELALPDRPPPRAEPVEPDLRPEEFALLEKLEAHVERGQQAAVIGVVHVLPLLRSLFERIALEQRPAVSFTTGLRLSVRRPFKLHFFPVDDKPLRIQLQNEGVTCIHAEPASGAPSQQPRERPSAFALRK